MKTKVFAAVLLSVFAFSSSAFAENWMAHIRGVYITPDNSSSPVSGVEADKQTIPELDFSYFVTPEWSVELILGTSRHEVSLNGTDLGKVSLLPPTVTAKYHYDLGNGFVPYAGLGLNHTLFYDVDLSSNLSVSTNSTGLALQVGADYKIGDNLYLNLDIKKVYIKTDVASNGNYLTTLDINPMLYGLGVGMKF
ncbi:MAG: OmpW [Bdellovibrio sp. ArHS]|uniref:OmpW/AlkL family protein n=1 Tax=Bdellovibrio sp. ArHS TaxID=1569284 RepID=UPI000583F75E|nr:OmpW family outer membrane protein [Bdellovibrio sp. ArHS]KHD89467.1 MAG: OmpW [Bdellovibrio sp. ArHS]